MCGIAGAFSRSLDPVPDIERRLRVQNGLLRHRGPDGEGTWVHASRRVGFAHRRLSIVDHELGAQPMTDDAGNWITYNGEVYNHHELREELAVSFATRSDTEVVLRAFRRWGPGAVERLRGMFAFALWDEERQALFCARDRFGMKPFYYTVAGGIFYFASEAKALLPFVEQIETDLDALRDYLAFQFCMDGKTLFRGIRELPPGHVMWVKPGGIEVTRYWELFFELDWDHTDRWFQSRLREHLAESVRLHLRADVPIGAYVSGGLDSSTIATLASRAGDPSALVGFHGRFPVGQEYDESRHAERLARELGFELRIVDVSATDFVDNVRKVIWHLDHPVAGPGSFSQFMVSRLVARERKVVLAGQGGDEVFGGYARYLIAYFEQCLKAAIDGTTRSGNFVVTYESIIPNLTSLREYKPLLQEFWRDGLFEAMDRRYFRLIDRAPLLEDIVRWDLLGPYSPFETFRSVFHGANVGKTSYFDLMTHFDLKTLLPALLHVEDRVSMAHGVETRVPLLDHPLVEAAARMPADVKFKDGALKRVFREAVRPFVPSFIVDRRDKMGFPTPFTDWIKGDARVFVRDTFSSRAALGRDLFDNRRVLEGLEREPRFGRKVWGLLCLELWQQQFHDRAGEWRRLLDQPDASPS